MTWPVSFRGVCGMSGNKIFLILTPRTAFLSRQWQVVMLHIITVSKSVRFYHTFNIYPSSYTFHMKINNNVWIMNKYPYFILLYLRELGIIFLCKGSIRWCIIYMALTFLQFVFWVAILSDVLTCHPLSSAIQPAVRWRPQFAPYLTLNWKI